MESNNFYDITNFKDYQLHPRITLGKKLAWLYNLVSNL
jgi:hypothetical protein